MKSRGSSYELGAGARKSLVLLWTAVLVCSVLLQYAAPAPAIAASGLLAGTVAGFEVDGNDTYHEIQARLAAENGGGASQFRIPGGGDQLLRPEVARA